MDHQDELRSHLRPAMFVAAAVAASLLITLGVVEFIRARFSPFVGFAPQLVTPVVRFALYGAGIFVIVLIRVLRQILLGRPGRIDRRTGLLRLQRASILTTIMSETPGVLGFVLFLIGGYNLDFYILAFVSLFLVFMHFPGRSGWEEWLMTAGGTS